MLDRINKDISLMGLKRSIQLINKDAQSIKVF